jgi:hypothetical protein
MPWKLDKNNVTPSVPLTKAEQDHLNEFMNKIRAGSSPHDAAAGWDSEYKRLAGEEYQIRLSRGNRVVFLVNAASQTVKIMQVGGHT